MNFSGRRMRWVLVCALAVFPALSQEPDSEARRLVETGPVTVAGQTAQYLIRRLPVNAFPDLPATVVAQLDQRHCLIPQSYEAHHPENVIHGSLERAGSSD